MESCPAARRPHRKTPLARLLQFSKVDRQSDDPNLKIRSPPVCPPPLGRPDHFQNWRHQFTSLPRPVSNTAAGLSFLHNLNRTDRRTSSLSRDAPRSNHRAWLSRHSNFAQAAAVRPSASKWLASIMLPLLSTRRHSVKPSGTTGPDGRCSRTTLEALTEDHSKALTCLPRGFLVHLLVSPVNNSVMRMSEICSPLHCESSKKLSLVLCC